MRVRRQDLEKIRKKREYTVKWTLPFRWNTERKSKKAKRETSIWPYQRNEKTLEYDCDGDTNCN